MNDRSPNCAWAHDVAGIRFEAVPMGGDPPTWRLFNRTHGVLLDNAMGFTSAASRGALLIGLDRAASAMGLDAFRAAVSGTAMQRQVVTLMRAGSGFRDEVGRVDVAFPAETALHDILQFALYELVDGHDRGDRTFHALLSDEREAVTV